MMYAVRIGSNYQTNVEAASPDDAVIKAVEFFADQFWKGPKPKSDTVLQVAEIYGDGRWSLLAFPAYQIA